MARWRVLAPAAGGRHMFGQTAACRAKTACAAWGSFERSTTLASAAQKETAVSPAARPKPCAGRCRARAAQSASHGLLGMMDPEVVLRPRCPAGRLVLVSLPLLLERRSKKLTLDLTPDNSEISGMLSRALRGRFFRLAPPQTSLPTGCVVERVIRPRLGLSSPGVVAFSRSTEYRLARSSSFAFLYASSLRRSDALLSTARCAVRSASPRSRKLPRCFCTPFSLWYARKRPSASTTPAFLNIEVPASDASGATEEDAPHPIVPAGRRAVPRTLAVLLAREEAQRLALQGGGRGVALEYYNRRSDGAG